MELIKTIEKERNSFPLLRKGKNYRIFSKQWSLCLFR